jgi:chromosomal replication initiation ATPase DnaA
MNLEEEMKREIAELKTRMASFEDILRILVNRSVLSKPGQQKIFEIDPSNPIFVIQKIVAKSYDINVFLLATKAYGNKTLRRARKTAMGLCAEHSGETHETISIAFGRSKPSTVSHAFTNMMALKEKDPEFHAKYELCEEEILKENLHYHKKKTDHT